MAILFVSIHNGTATDGLLPEGAGRTAYRKTSPPTPIPWQQVPFSYTRGGDQSHLFTHSSRSFIP